MQKSLRSGSLPRRSIQAICAPGSNPNPDFAAVDILRHYSLITGSKRAGTKIEFPGSRLGANCKGMKLSLRSKWQHKAWGVSPRKQ